MEKAKDSGSEVSKATASSKETGISGGVENPQQGNNGSADGQKSGNRSKKSNDLLDLNSKSGFRYFYSGRKLL